MSKIKHAGEGKENEKISKKGKSYNNNIKYIEKENIKKKKKIIIYVRK